MARKTKEEAEKTRATLIEAAEKIFYTEGVARTSLQKIAESVGLTRGAFYWHFRNKAELMDAMLNKVMMPQETMLEQLIESDPEKPLKNLLKAVQDSMHAMITDQACRRVMTIVMQRCEYIEDMNFFVERCRKNKERMQDRLIVLLESARRKGHLTNVWTPALAAFSMHTFFVGLLMNELERGEKPVSDKDVTTCLQAFFRSLAVSDEVLA